MMLLVQVASLRMAGTPRLGCGLVVSCCLAALASVFSWYAMRRGAMLGGINQTTGADPEVLQTSIIDRKQCRPATRCSLRYLFGGA
jgi:hypothetical protein